MKLRALIGLLPFAVAAPLYAAPNVPPFALENVKASTDIINISMKERSSRWEVAVSATRSVPFSGRKIKEGNRFYVDFPDCRLSVGRPVLTLEQDGATVRAAQFSIDPAIVRVVIQSTEGSAATLITPAPSDTAVITLPVKARTRSVSTTSRNQTRIEISALTGIDAASVFTSRPLPPSRSRLASRGGRVIRPDPSELVFPPDAMEAYDDPPVPSTGGSLTPVMDADLPDALKEGARVALSGNRKYVWGGETPSGFDCSGMMQFIYRYTSVQLPRTAAEQYKTGMSVAQEDLQPGDLVFFSNGKRIFHVGMYIGNGRIFHAANPRRGLTTDMLSSTFYANHYAGARRPRQG